MVVFAETVTITLRMIFQNVLAVMELLDTIQETISNYLFGVYLNLYPQVSVSLRSSELIEFPLSVSNIAS